MIRRDQENITVDPTSVVMPVMNNLQYTKSFMDSFYRQVSDPYELIIIDNASTDGTAEYLSEISSQNDRIKIITNEKNKGVCPSWNQGILASKYDYVCIVNNDIEFMTLGLLGEMQKVIKKSPNIYWVSPATIYIKDIKKLQYKPFHYEQLQYGVSNMRYIVGCCFMCPKRAFSEEEIGLFDEKFFPAYYEDLDYINRIMQNGKGLSMCSSATVYHAVGTTSRKTPNSSANESYYKQKWEGTQFDILAMQKNRGKQ